MFEASVSIDSKICQKSFSLAIFQLHKYQVLALINVPAIRKRQQDSGKFRSVKKKGILNFHRNFENICRVYIWKKYRYIFQIICRTKLILMHEKITEIIIGDNFTRP